MIKLLYWSRLPTATRITRQCLFRSIWILPSQLWYVLFWSQNLRIVCVKFQHSIYYSGILGLCLFIFVLCLYVHSCVCVCIWGPLSSVKLSVDPVLDFLHVVCLLSSFHSSLNLVKLFQCCFSVLSTMPDTSKVGETQIAILNICCIFLLFFSLARSSFSFLSNAKWDLGQSWKVVVSQLFLLFSSGTFICGLWLITFLMTFCWETRHCRCGKKKTHKRATTLSLIFISLSLCFSAV